MLYKLPAGAELPKCICFGRFRQKNGWNHRGRTTDRNLLLIFINGDARFTIDGEVTEVKHGDQLLIPAGIRYTANTVGGCEYYFLHFTDRIVSVSSRPNERLNISRTINIEDQKKPECYLPAFQDISNDYKRIMLLLIGMDRLRSTGRRNSIFFSLIFRDCL